MHRLLPAQHLQALHSTASSRRIEVSSKARLAPHELMARAGMALAKLATALAPHERRVWVACGPGNNGGDGLVAATLLHQAGWQVEAALISSEGTPPADAAWALEQARAAGVAITQSLPAMKPGLLIDALLGLGSTRAPEGQMVDWVRYLNSQPAPVLAVDLPTGLDSDTGRKLGDTVVHASHCLSLLTLKRGLFTAHGRDCCGDLWFDDLGCAPTEPPDAWLLGQDSMLVAQGSPLPSAHKGSQGDVLVIGGAPGMQGAARLAARSALAAGAGRVYASLLDSTTMPDPVRAELMQRPVAQLKDDPSWHSHCVVAGCGGGSEIGALLPLLLEHAARLVLDADGLNALTQNETLMEFLRARSSRGLQTILTPHPLEAARLLDSSVASIQADRLAAADALSQRYDCTVLLKGAGSVIASPGSCPAINSSGGPALATAGTGDVLAGWLGGIWASHAGVPAHDLACAAAHWHGLAGDQQKAGPLRAGDLIEAMHALHGHVSR